MYTQFLPFMTDTTSLAVDAAPAVSALAGLIAEGANLITRRKLRKMRFPPSRQVGRRVRGEGRGPVGPVGGACFTCYLSLSLVLPASGRAALLRFVFPAFASR